MAAVLLVVAGTAFAQPVWPPQFRPPEPALPSVPRKYRVQPPENVPEGEVSVSAVEEEKNGPRYKLRGNARVQTNTFILRGDEIDYNEDTADAEARGHVYLQHFEGGEELWADRAEYNFDSETGKFYNVRGTAPLHIEARPRVLTSSSPFHFEGKWAEKIEDKYILHDGFITNCKVPNPWWTLTGPVFDVIPGQRAKAYRTVFRVKRVPLFYTPYFYKSLARMPRRSGFLTPNIGNSSRRGKMIGIGYYWAMSRSYDGSYRAQYFTQRGFAHTVDFRGMPNQRTDFNAYVYGVNDRGIKVGNSIQKQGGFIVSVLARSDLGHGFYGRADINYLSSFEFRQAFTETFNEAISSEEHSVAFVTRQWDTFGADAVFQRVENFQSLEPDDTIIIRKLPQFEFSSRDRRLFRKVPIWVSWQSEGGLVRRKQLLFQTRNFLDRMDVYPRISTAFHWKDFGFLPSFAIRETHYGETQQIQQTSNGSVTQIIGQNTTRGAREFDLVVKPPSFARVFDHTPKWLGDKIKHVIEPEVEYKYVTGVDDFQRLIRFDETELYSNTNEVRLSLTNRLYAKRGDRVEEVLSWQLRQSRYFDPTFGGAVTNWCGRPECRNLVLSSIELTPYAFLSGPRDYSPVVSILRMNPKSGLGVEWRADYDPLRHSMVNSGMTVDARFGLYFFSVGQNSLSTSTALAPKANQFRGMFTIGNDNRRGWNAGFSTVYDVRIGVMQFATSQVTYNTDCCGFSVQYRRFSFGTRNENQFRVAFAVANIGNFGTLKKQEQMF